MSPFEANGQREMLSAGIALSIKPTVLLCRFPRALAVRTATIARNCHFDRKRGNAMKPNLITVLTTLLAGTFATAVWAQDLGRVHFETSCTAQAQEKFGRGLAMVHSFFYPDSVQAFTEAAAADPQCAIAYWGIAISHRPNPMILPLTSTILKNGLEAVEKGKAIGAKTERERDWLAAIEFYYKDYDKIDQTRRHPGKDRGKTTGPSRRAALSDPHLRLPYARPTRS